jgi:hypothetical protein
MIGTHIKPRTIARPFEYDDKGWMRIRRDDEAGHSPFFAAENNLLPGIGIHELVFAVPYFAL